MVAQKLSHISSRGRVLFDRSQRKIRGHKDEKNWLFCNSNVDYHEAANDNLKV